MDFNFGFNLKLIAKWQEHSVS